MDPLHASILIVDDDERNRELLGESLRAAGFRNLSYADSGPDTLARLADHLPDMILLGMMAPGTSSSQVIERIRKAYPDHYLPIVLAGALLGSPPGTTAGEEQPAGAAPSWPQPTQMDAFFSQIANPVIFTDQEGRITLLNSPAELLLQLPQSAAGKHLAQMFGPALADLLLRADERQAPISGEFTLRRANEPNQAFSVSVSPISGVGFVLVWQDITALKEGESVRLESERAERQRVFEALSRYIAPALVKRVLSDRDILNRRERREATILFADLRGFTRLTIEHSPDEVITLLNDFFTEMMEIAYENEGVVFDIAGDELMIGFNVPYPQPDARHRALITAAAMQRHFAALKEQWQQRGIEVGMGIGANHGPVVLGHVGGRYRMNYAMVGEAVNIAHRLVEVARDGQIVVTPEMLAEGVPEGETFSIEEAPPLQVGGKDDSLAAFVIEVR